MSNLNEKFLKILCFRKRKIMKKTDRVYNKNRESYVEPLKNELDSVEDSQISQTKPQSKSNLRSNFIYS